MEANRASAIEYICYAVKWASMYNAITQSIFVCTSFLCQFGTMRLYTTQYKCFTYSAALLSIEILFRTTIFNVLVGNALNKLNLNESNAEHNKQREREGEKEKKANYVSFIIELF